MIAELNFIAIFIRIAELPTLDHCGMNPGGVFPGLLGSGAH